MIDLDNEKVVKEIYYCTKVRCAVLDTGAVVPTSSTHHIEDTEKGEFQNQTEYPPLRDILIIWLGYCVQFPQIKKK
jgi:hypothetical protein